MGKFIRWLTIASKKVFDAYQKKSYTWRMVMVPKPTIESPFPCILVSLSNGHSKLLLRLSSLEAYYEAFRLTPEEEGKVKAALIEARQEADKIEEDMRLLFQKRHLPEGAQIVRTDTGEVLAVADQILKDSNDHSR